MIPKIIHYCWFGGGEKSPLLQRCMESWKKVLPEYEIREWSEESLGVITNQYVQQAYAQKKWAFVSDVMRLHALYSQGGIYLDTDVEIHRPFDNFLEHNFFIGSECNQEFKSIGTAVFGATVNNDIIRDMIELYQNIPFLKKNGQYDDTPNTVRLVKILLQHGAPCVYTEKERVQIKPGAFIYPVHFFCSASKDSYAVHHFAASWVEDFRRKLKFQCPWFRGSFLKLYKYRQRKPGAVFSLEENEEMVFSLNYSKKAKLCLLRVKCGEDVIKK